jgi:NitT/TauT family transport system permease protein
LVIFIAGWEAVVWAFNVPKIVLPPPSAIAVAFWTSLADGELAWHLAVTLYEILAGFVVGSIGGWCSASSSRSRRSWSASSIPTW